MGCKSAEEQKDEEKNEIKKSVIDLLKEEGEDKKDEKDKKGAVFKHVGNLSFDQIKKIAENMRPKSLAREMKGTVKEVLGSCVAVGITVDGKSPKDVQKEIDEGKYKI